VQVLRFLKRRGLTQERTSENTTSSTSLGEYGEEDRAVGGDATL
jgi:hypothetical protein